MENKSELDQRVDPFWTIWFPLGVSVFLTVLTAVSFIVAYFSGGEVSKWASAFSSLMISFVLFTSIISIIFLVFSIAGMKELSKNTPGWLSKLQLFSMIGNENEKRFMNALTKPVVFIKQGLAGLNSIISRK
jgi:amino acid transporter